MRTPPQLQAKVWKFSGIFTAPPPRWLWDGC